MKWYQGKMAQKWSILTQQPGIFAGIPWKNHQNLHTYNYKYYKPMKKIKLPRKRKKIFLKFYIARYYFHLRDLNKKLTETTGTRHEKFHEIRAPRTKEEMKQAIETGIFPIGQTF